MKFNLRINLCRFIFAIAALLVAASPMLEAQTISESLSLANGTLNWSQKLESVNARCATEVYLDSNFTFIYNGVTQYLPGSATYTQSPYTSTSTANGCPLMNQSPANLMLNVVEGAVVCSIDFRNGGNIPAPTMAPTWSCSYPGIIEPKYQIVGVTYAPPGTSSYVNYSNTQSVGNTSTISQTFSDDLGFSISTTNGVQIPAAVGTTAGVKLTYTLSTDYTQGWNNSNTGTITKSTSIAYQTGGTPTESPVNHDYDVIWIWLNPEVLLTYVQNSNGAANVVWNGYGFDPSDPASGQPPASGPYYGNPDVEQVIVGCLNGDFQCPSTLTWQNGVQAPGSYVVSGSLARGWQSSANGYAWPAGESAGLSFNEVCEILNTDPLATTPKQCPVQNNYTGFAGYPYNTADGRYSWEPEINPLNYPVGGGTTIDTLQQVVTNSSSSGGSYSVKVGFTASQQFGGSIFFGLGSSNTTLTESNTFIWTHTWLNTLTTITTLSDALHVSGPPITPAYSGPVEFDVYQDNLFGTFVFVPAN
ncbi:MAG: hypothetical protein ABR906_09185 [Terracidiphilus sp.]|jgi:hypothetical protein